MRKFKHAVSRAENPKGVQGEISKVREEYVELKDADKQQDWLFQVIEASDLIYAVRSYGWKQLRIPLFVLYLFALVRRPWKWYRDRPL